MFGERCGVWREQFGDTGIDGVVGEEDLRGGGENRDLRVEQRQVESGDAIADTGRPFA